MISPWSASVPSDSASLARGLGRVAVSGVVLHAPHQQRHPPGQDEDFAVLLQGDALALEGGDPAEPGPALGQELTGRQERILRAHPVGHDPEAVQRRLVKIRTLQTAHQLQRVHTADRQHI